MLARDMLAGSTLNINEIAALTGLVSYVNFYKAFLKREGMSPGEYRARCE